MAEEQAQSLILTRLEFVTGKVADHMDRILTHFKPGAKITVLVRTPGNDEADFCLSDDAMDEAIAALHRRRAAGQTGEV